MRYGHFDEKAREYVIERPDTPKPWANYLGSPEYGAIISNNAGGYSFVKSGANGRIIRYIFNGEDKPVEFKADRNGIARVWMDHGMWPFLTTELYLNQTGDYSILSEEVPYFEDRQIFRGTDT